MLLTELTVKQNPCASRIENFNYNSLLYNKMFIWKGTSEVLATLILLSSDGNWFTVGVELLPNPRHRVLTAGNRNSSSFDLRLCPSLLFLTSF